jgi:flagellar biogenesis protein FliO
LGGLNFKWWESGWRCGLRIWNEREEKQAMSTSGTLPLTAVIAEALQNGLARLRLLASSRFKRNPGRLELCETLSLGNRGFLAVVRCEGQRFLLGGTNGSLAMLAQLQGSGVERESELALERGKTAADEE